MRRPNSAAPAQERPLSAKDLELLCLFLARYERMRTALEAIRAECDRGQLGAWRTRIGELAALGLRQTP